MTLDNRKYAQQIAASMRAVKRLMDDINRQPLTDLVLSTSPVHGTRYYCVEPVGGNWIEMELWCHKCYGEPGEIWPNESFVWPEAARWLQNNRKFWFRNEADRTMFLLKWR